MPKSFSRCSLLVLILFPTLALGTDQWPVARGASKEPAPYQYDPEVWKTVPSSFLDDASACVLLAASTYNVHSDGTIETTTHDITRLNSRKSLEQLGEYRGIAYDPAFEKLTLNIARVHKRDRKTVEVEARHVHLRDVSTDFHVYDQEKQLVVSFPTLEVGDVIEIKWTIRGKNPEHLGQFFTRYGFGTEEYPVVHDQLRVLLPKDRQLKFTSENGKLEPTITESQTTREYLWKTTNLPRVPREEDRPARDELRTVVSCSTFQSWEEIARWKKTLRAECWVCTPEIKQLVKKLTASLRSDEEKARALTYWVKQNIRYISAGSTHDYTPHPPAQVLKNLHGDCKDTCQLLAVMLKEAKISVALVTLGCRGDGQVKEAVPSPWGTHGILLVRIDGKENWIDTTATLYPWNFLPAGCRNRVAYLLEGDRIWLQKTPALTANDHRFEQITEVKIALNGTSVVQRKEEYHGLAAANQRDRWYEIPSGEQRRLVTSALQDSNSQARLIDLKIDESSLKVLDKHVEATIHYEIPAQFAGKDREGSFTDPRVWQFLLGYQVSNERKLAMELYAPVISNHRFLVHAPPGYEFARLPESGGSKSSWGTFIRNGRWVGQGFQSIEIDFKLVLHDPRVETSAFSSFQQFQQDVLNRYRVWLTLEPVNSLKHTAELEQLLKTNPRDAEAALTLARIYLHHDKSGDANRALRLARENCPDDKRVWALSVKATNDRKEAEVFQRQLVKRFPTDSSQALVLAAMLIDRNREDLAEPLLLSLTKVGVSDIRALAHYQLARSYLKKERPEQALQALACASNEESSRELLLSITMLRGRALEKVGKGSEAIQSYEKAHTLDRTASDPLLALLDTSENALDSTKRITYLQRYISLQDGNLQGLLRAAEMALRLGRNELAHDLAHRARELGFSEQTQRILGLAHLRRQEWQSAAFHLERADLSPLVLGALMEAYLELGNLSGAVREARRVENLSLTTADLKLTIQRVHSLQNRAQTILARLPENSRANLLTAAEHLVCAEDAWSRGRPQKQIVALLEKEIKTASLAETHSLKADLALHEGKLRDAFILSEKAVQLQSADVRAWHIRGLIRLERGEPAALGDLLKATELSQQQDGLILRDLAEAYRASGQMDLARQTLEKAARLRPTDVSIQKLRVEWEALSHSNP